GFISKSSGIDDIRRSIQTVLAGDIATPDSYRDGQEQDPDVADLIHRLHTLTPQQSRVLTPGMARSSSIRSASAWAP
ncbi:hypothetical protein ACC702_40250, partial [Rhizobium ruizarguesonis]